MVTVKFAITSNGSVSTSTASGLDGDEGDQEYRVLEAIEWRGER
jgi:hypothetical protein